jgi:hypothetical protein
LTRGTNATPSEAEQELRPRRETKGKAEDGNRRSELKQGERSKRTFGVN